MGKIKKQTSGVEDILLIVFKHDIQCTISILSQPIMESSLVYSRKGCVPCSEFKKTIDHTFFTLTGKGGGEKA